MAFNCSKPINSKITVNNIKIEGVNEFNDLSNYVPYKDEIDLGKKIEIFNCLNVSIYTNMKNEVRKDTSVNFYKTMPIPSLLYCSSETYNNRNKWINNPNSRDENATENSRRDRIRNTEIREQSRLLR